MGQRPSEAVRREILPIPDRTRPGLTTYDAKDPDTTYPPIIPLRRINLPPVRKAPVKQKRSLQVSTTIRLHPRMPCM